MKRFAISMCVATLVFATRPAVADITVSFSPSDAVVGLGDIFTVDIVADIPLADAIVGWGMDVGFDAGIVAHGGPPDVAIAPAFFFPGTLDGDGLAGVLPFAFPPPLPVFGPSVVLATMTFTAVSLGVSDLLGSVTPGDLTEGFALPGFPVGPGGFAAVSFVDGTITVIPAPGAALLAMIGFGGVGAIRRRA